MTCTCGYWQLDCIPCGHVKRVITVNKYQDCSLYVLKVYHTETLRKTYEESVNPFPKPSEWEIPDGLMTVRPLIMDKRQPGRPTNIERNPPQDVGPKRKECSTCGQAGHMRNNCARRASGSGASRMKIPTKETTINIGLLQVIHRAITLIMN
ncbi:uncharacterized protein LOC111885294 [Lactuca sativa]|uniref:uncharacterized protein LOC111885294 n=1 Tax=Lactuca sativa TaxID=4236 RepID=UPI000CD997EA|nr:uncharacterized protein LOC111885294 [Lactuca sativa]